MSFRSLFAIISLITISAGESHFFEGVTEPYQSATISSVLAGRVSKVLKHEGSYVKRGRTILSLEKKEEELRVSRAKLIAKSKATLSSAKFRLDNAKHDYNATKELFEKTGSVSEEELSEKKLVYQIAEAEHTKLEMIEQKEELEYRMEVSNLENHVIRAPFSGTVVKLNREVGESCEALEPLIYLVNVSKCRFVTYIDPTSGYLPTEKDTVSLEIEGGKGTIKRNGIIEFVSPVVDPASGLQRVKIVVNNRDGEIRPGVSGMMISRGK